ncbi:MAG: esterase [Prevotella sp.]|nr:esterase [Prevotella sp.]
MDGRKVEIFAHERPEMLLIQPSGSHETNSIAPEVGQIEAESPTPFAFASFAITDWERELAPWEDAELSRREGVGQQARGSLASIEGTLLPLLQNRFGPLPCILGGYSLAALFALWSACETTSFRAVAAASPSVWLKDWPAYASAHRPHATTIYLSLGDREEKTRNKTFARIGDNIRSYHQLLTEQLGEGHTVLEWNAGNHFADADKRTARAFVWCMNQLQTQQL